MKIKNRIISLLLALILLFSFVSMTVLAAPIAVKGSTITEEDIEEKNLEAVKSSIPKATGPLSYANIKKQIGADNMATGDKYGVSDKRAYATYKDANGNVVHLNDWRLPTAAEIAIIAQLQYNSVSVDEVLAGRYYFCASPKHYADGNVSDSGTGGYIRCIRDAY